MQKYTATLTKDIVTTVRFVSACAMTGNEIGGYDVQHHMKAGARGFKRLRDAKAWVARVNSEHGANTAVMGSN